MDLSGRDIKLNGQEYCILAGRPTHDPELKLYLLSVKGEKQDYSLWLGKTSEDGKRAQIRPYEGDNVQELIKELLEYFLEHAFDPQPSPRTEGSPRR